MLDISKKYWWKRIKIGSHCRMLLLWSTFEKTNNKELKFPALEVLHEIQYEGRRKKRQVLKERPFEGSLTIYISGKSWQNL